MKKNWRSRNNNRNVALILIGVGIYLLLDNHFGFFTVLALLFILFGINKIRTASVRKGYIFIGIGLVILIGGNLSLLLAVVLISLGFFYIRSKQLQRGDDYVRKQSLIESIRWGREPWVLRSSSIWNVLGELQIDLTYAIPEQQETTIVLQGVIADVDIIVPEDMGVSVTSSVLFGQSDIGPLKEAGALNKTVWQSQNYETADTRVKLLISYVVADVDIKIV
ncbi:cell wall-active antibiotics response protein LiaF [Paenibacillus sp. UNC451MF]|uniref:cell wall-active antibiotics response protein LiaF n=1 Tax=Paenibacillus sp. UNC451MF TaxID=1449063 RepID=UPI00048FBC93|nr:cell wall-active antibiotics response protein LiaF [Paenibacillus sp. UNC451MF]